jgi:transposase
MPRGRQLTDQERGKIDAFLEVGLSYRDIARRLNRAEGTIHYHVKLSKTGGSRKRSERPSKVTKRLVRQIFRFATVKKFSSKHIAAALGGILHHTTIRNILKSTALCKYIKRKSVPALKKRHMVARTNFAVKFLNKNTIWDRVVFSDEKKFNLDGPDGYQFYWHDLRKEVEVYSTRVNGGGSVMVWAGMSCYGKTQLAFLEGRQNSQCYTKTLDDYLLPYLEELRDDHGISDPIFQHDNASIHESQYTRSHMRELGFDRLLWPSKSPDLNPIENVWGQLAGLVYEGGRQFETRGELKTQITRCWQKIETSYLQRLVESMPTRMAQVILTRGKGIDK